MGMKLFLDALRDAPIGKNDRKWFPKWLQRYAEHLKLDSDETLSIDTQCVIRFLQHLRDSTGAMPTPRGAKRRWGGHAEYDESPVIVNSVTAVAPPLEAEVVG